MHSSHRQEAFSLAFVRAIAATAGFRLQDGTLPDDDSVDLTIAARGAMGTLRSPKLDVQLKSRLGRPQEEPIWSYDLKAKNYEDLRHTDLQVPRILVVVAVPEADGDWLDQDEDRLLLRHSAWWVSLRGAPPSSNSTTVRVGVPRKQLFDVPSLTSMMERLGGGLPP